MGFFRSVRGQEGVLFHDLLRVCHRLQILGSLFGDRDTKLNVWPLIEEFRLYVVKNVVIDGIFLIPYGEAQLLVVAWYPLGEPEKTDMTLDPEIIRIPRCRPHPATESGGDLECR